MYKIKYNNKLYYSADSFYPFGTMAQDNPTIFANKEDAEHTRKMLMQSYRINDKDIAVEMVA